MFLANTLTIVLAQLPIAKLLEGRRRMRALAAMTVAWAAAWAIVFVSGSLLDGAPAAAAIAVAAVVFGLGECALGPAQSALVADLAPLAIWPVAAVLLLAAGAGAIRLERSLPAAVRLSPLP